MQPVLSTFSDDEVLTIFRVLCDWGLDPGSALALICASKKLKMYLMDAPESLRWREAQRAGEAFLEHLAGMSFLTQLRTARKVTFPSEYPIGMLQIDMHPMLIDKHPMLILGTLSPLLLEVEDCSIDQGVEQLATGLLWVLGTGMRQHPFPQLRSLCLRGSSGPSRMGDPGATKLAKAMAKGALPHLVVLGGYCHIEPRPTHPPIDRLLLSSPRALCQIWPTTASAIWDWRPSHRPCCAWPR